MSGSIRSVVDTPSPDTGPDPVDSPDPQVLRHEILRLRDTALGEQARADVLADRVAELEAELHTLGARAEALQARLDRSPVELLARVVRRLRRR